MNSDVVTGIYKNKKDGAQYLVDIDGNRVTLSTEDEDGEVVETTVSLKQFKSMQFELLQAMGG
jgi:hypothetical protein